MTLSKITVLLAALVLLSATNFFQLFLGENTDNDDKVNSQLTESRDALPGEYPWMVALHRSGRFLCSSFLVTPKFVMTAAHCLAHGKTDDHTLYTGYIGTINNRGSPDKMISFKEVHAHPEWSGKIGENDLAILKLEQPLKLSENIQTICLPTKGFIAENMTAQFVGWRIDINGEGNFPKKLQTVTLKVLTKSMCALVYTNLGVNLTQNHICAGSDKDKGFCSMGSGSPLVVIENKPVAIGINSFTSHSECMRGNAPAVFIDTSMYSDWIMETMGDDANDLCFISKTSTIIKRWGSEPHRVFYMSTQ